MGLRISRAWWMPTRTTLRRRTRMNVGLAKMVMRSGTVEFGVGLGGVKHWRLR